eukprot:NODE_2082_length_1516_cov_114.015793_g1981_i0.p1 GENE.NODE_2082_length_1516_cov_114.015793_g1981_i0~~NODE_2082_length_1516_cov_114.015793_g1981_i0.p1  ORF type:complete len:374 (+),score=46.96 NODE_2082_length_1516_cov_114.015793_g1981_i0:335-1456(+)
MKTEFREVMFRTGQCMKPHLHECLDMLTAPILHPLFSDEALEEGKQQAVQDIEYTFREPSKILFEHIHRTAFQGSTVGQPLWPEPAVIKNITSELLHEYIRELWAPNRVAVVVSGADQNELSSICESMFTAPASPPLITAPSEYKGGECLIYNEDPPPTTFEKFQDRNLTHIGLVFKGLPESDERFFALAVLQFLLGGGTAFSAGGPGKGMYTKLFRTGINIHGHWLWGIEAVMSAFSDVGLFGLYSQAPHENVEHLIAVTVMQMATITRDIDQSMLDMAKNQYLSLLFMMCEERVHLIEGIGKSAVLYDKLWSPDVIKERVQSLTIDDLVNVGNDLFRSNPTYVVFGNTKAVASYEVIGRQFVGVRKQLGLL